MNIVSVRKGRTMKAVTIEYFLGAVRDDYFDAACAATGEIAERLFDAYFEYLENHIVIILCTD